MTKDNNTSTRYAPNAFSAHLIFKQPIITDTAIPSVIIKDTNKIAFIGNSNLALKIAQVIQKQAQVIKAFPKYEVSAFNELGEPAEVFIDINLPNVSCDKLVNYKFNDIKYAMKIRGAGNNKVDIQKLKLKRNNYLKNGKL